MTDVFDLFGTPEADPALREAVQGLSDAVRDAVARSGGLSRPPDLTAISDAVRAVLDASGHQAAVTDADRWHEYESDGRERRMREGAWRVVDVAFRGVMQEAGYPCAETTTGGREGRRALPLLDEPPSSAPEE